MSKKPPKSNNPDENRIEIHDLWLVQTFQNGRLDSCEGPTPFATEQAAREYAIIWSGEVPYGACKHEAIIFKAVTVVRGVIRPRQFEIEDYC